MLEFPAQETAPTRRFLRFERLYLNSYRYILGLLLTRKADTIKRVNVLYIEISCFLNDTTVFLLCQYKFARIFYLFFWRV